MVVAAAGAIGAMSRYGVTRWLPSDAAAGEFPAATLVVNLVGSLIFGVVVGLGGQLPEWMRIALLAGVCGAFTTFSTFAYETLALWTSGRVGLAVGQVLLQVVVAIALIAVGLWIGRSLGE